MYLNQQFAFEDAPRRVRGEKKDENKENYLDDDFIRLWDCQENNQQSDDSKKHSKQDGFVKKDFSISDKPAALQS